MKRPRLTYLIFTALLLFNGYDRAFAGADQQTFISSSAQDLQIRNNSSCNNNQESVAFLPDTVWDDDDEDPMPDREKASFPDNSSALANVFLFDPGSATIVPISHLSGNYSYSFPARYIFQRVLRI
jgi:hypothetical protein